ncbi:MAG: sensor histidine kinase [Steroidobacter sp.]
MSPSARASPLLYGMPGALLTAFVLVAGVTLTWLAWDTTSQAEEQRARDELAMHAMDIQTALYDRLLAYEGLLRAGAGLIDAFGSVSAQHWRIFVAELSLAAVYPGIQGVGFAVPIRSAADVERWRYALRSLGVADLVSPASGEQTLPESLIVFLEPLDHRNRRAIGFDMMSEPVRRRAMERACEDGAPALSGKVTLVQELERNVQAGFLLYLPVYDGADQPTTIEERRRELRGFVYSPFRAVDFFESALDIAPTDAILEVFDGGLIDAEALLYRSTSTPSRDRLTDIRKLSLAGHEWILRVSSGTVQGSGAPGAAHIIAISGGMITLLLAAIVSMLALSRQRLRERMDANRALAHKERLLNDSLEQRVAERTAQLEAANSGLSAANRDLEAFTYSVSHDLRAPLRAIDSHVARFSEGSGALSEAQQHHAGAVRRNIARMTQLIDDLLNFAMVSRRPLDKRRIIMWELVHPILQDVQYSQPIEIEADAEELGEAYADPALLQQALTNLIANAAKFSRGANPARIAIGCDAASGERVYFVRDNGVGFDMQHASKLFGVFERLHHASEFDGMGVGLAIVKQIIERHGGRVWAESEPNRGATFYFTLPDS